MTLATSEEKSVTFCETDSWSTLIPAAWKTGSIAADQAGRVGLLVIDDHQGLGVQGLHDVVRVLRALHAVLRHHPEERRVRAGRQRHGSRRAGDEGHPGPAHRAADRLDFLAARRAGHGDDARVRDELLGHRRRLRGLQLGVALDERDLRLVGRVVRRHRELREVQLLLTERRHRAGERSLQSDRRDARLGGGGCTGGSAARGGTATAAATATSHGQRANRRRS